ncbi:flagellar hook-length control protein FliK [Lacunimicrobium album]
MNANSLIERLTSMALALPTGTPDSSNTAQKAASAADAPYARELRKSLEKSDKANASTADAHEKPKASHQAEETQSGTPARHDELTPRREASSQASPKPAVTSVTPVAEEGVPTPPAEPAIDVIDEVVVSTTLTSDVQRFDALDAISAGRSSASTPADEPATEPDLQAMIESILQQLQQIANTQAESTQTQGTTTPTDAKTSAIPAGLQQAIQQVMHQTSPETQVADPAAQAQQAIDMIDELISRFGKDVEEDEEDDKDGDACDVEDDLSKIQALLEQITGQQQVAETPVVVQVTANVWGDVGAASQVEANKPSAGQPVSTPEVELPEIAVEAASENGASSEAFTLVGDEFASASAETTATDVTSIDSSAEASQPEPDQAAVRVDATSAPSRVVNTTSGPAGPGEIEGSRQAAAIQLINRVSQSISTGATQGEQSFKMQVGAGELGQLQIEVTTHKGAVTAVIHAEQPSTQKLLVEHMQHLRDSLVQAGHNVDKIQVETSPDGSMFEDFTRQQSSQSSQQDDQNNVDYPLFDLHADDKPTTPQPASRPSRHITSRDQLDIAI